MTCPHLTNETCELATWIANKECPTTPEICQACCRTENPMDINEVVNTLADVQPIGKGPGTTLKKTLDWFVRVPPGCNCMDRVVVMDNWGSDRCEKEKSTILGWLRESALDAGYSYSEYVISHLVNWVIKKHRTNQ